MPDLPSWSPNIQPTQDREERSAYRSPHSVTPCRWGHRSTHNRKTAHMYTPYPSSITVTPCRWGHHSMDNRKIAQMYTPYRSSITVTPCRRGHRSMDNRKIAHMYSADRFSRNCRDRGKNFDLAVFRLIRNHILE
jgi:hypothetical protein